MFRAAGASDSGSAARPSSQGSRTRPSPSAEARGLSDSGDREGPVRAGNGSDRRVAGVDETLNRSASGRPHRGAENSPLASEPPGLEQGPGRTPSLGLPPRRSPQRLTPRCRWPRSLRACRSRLGRRCTIPAHDLLCGGAVRLESCVHRTDLTDGPAMPPPSRPSGIRCLSNGHRGFACALPVMRREPATGPGAGRMPASPRPPGRASSRPGRPSGGPRWRRAPEPHLRSAE